MQRQPSVTYGGGVPGSGGPPALATAGAHHIGQPTHHHHLGQQHQQYNHPQMTTHHNRAGHQQAHMQAMMGAGQANKMFQAMQQQQMAAAASALQTNTAMEQVWLKAGMLAMRMEDWEKAVACCEAALKQNPHSISAYYCLAASLHQQCQLVQAIEVYHRLLVLLQNTSNNDQTKLRGEVWASIGHCALLLDDLARAFSAFQQALQILGSPKDASVWFAIGLLYDRYGADELAREAFLITLKYEHDVQKLGDPISMRQREVYYRLGLIYMNLKRWELSRECFLFAMDHPPAGLGREDVAFYIGILHSIQGEIEEGRTVLEHIGGKVVNGAIIPPTHEVDCSRSVQLKARETLGWYEALCNGREGVPRALAITQAAVDEEPTEGFGWYCLGRINMLNKDYTKAYDAYQQAVYRDGTNASFWNSIGILYFHIGQYRDALDAYSRSIHLAPFVADTWWNLGVLYEISHKQYDDAQDAYNRASELDPDCAGIQERLALIKSGKVLQSEAVPKPVEYCPIPFFSRPVILGKAFTLPLQRPATTSHANPLTASSINAQPMMHEQQQMSLHSAALLQQSRMAQLPPSFSARNPGLSSGNGAFSLPTPGPNQGLMQPRHQNYQQPIGPRPVANIVVPSYSLSFFENDRILLFFYIFGENLKLIQSVKSGNLLDSDITDWEIFEWILIFCVQNKRRYLYEQLLKTLVWSKEPSDATAYPVLANIQKLILFTAINQEYQANSKRSKPIGRRPNSRDPITPGGAGFRFSEVKLNSDPSDNEETIKSSPNIRPNAGMPSRAAQMNTGKANTVPTGAATSPSGRPTGIGGLKPLSTGATVQASHVQAAQPTSSRTANSQPNIQAPADKRTTGGFLPRSAMPPNRQPVGISMEPKTADLESIGHSMKSQNTRIQEAEQKYGSASTLAGPTGPMGGYGSTHAPKPSRFSYANPPPPELRPKETLPPVNRTGTQQQDLEANKTESSGKGKKIFLFILIGLLVAGLIAGAVVGIVIAVKKAPVVKK